MSSSITMKRVQCGEEKVRNDGIRGRKTIRAAPAEDGGWGWGMVRASKWMSEPMSEPMSEGDAPSCQVDM